MDTVTAEWVREYRYRTVMHATHEQYLDEPLDVVEWMLHIHDVYEKQRSTSPPAGA